MSGQAPKVITWKGQTRTLSEWAKLVGLKYQTIHRRLKLGHNPDDVLTKPIARTGLRMDGTATMTSARMKEVMTNSEMCGCEDCQRARPLSKPRTAAERTARWRKEQAARQLARSERNR